MRVLVTGASGFLGSEVVRQVLAAGMRPIALVRPAGRLPRDLEGAVATIAADVTTFDALSAALPPCDAACHCAGLAHAIDREPPHSEYERVNLLGSQNVYRASTMAGSRRFIQVSTVSVYGPHPPIVMDEERPCAPQSSYAVTKHQAETSLAELAVKDGVPLLILRMATILGEGDPGNMGRLLAALARLPVAIVPRGATRKSFVHKSDAARACTAALTSGERGVEVANISAQPAELAEIIEWICQLLGRRAVPVPAGAVTALCRMGRGFAPGWRALARLESQFDRLFSDEQFSNTRASSVLGWTPQIGWRDAIQMQMRRTNQLCFR